MSSNRAQVEYLLDLQLDNWKLVVERLEGKPTKGFV